MTRFSKYILSAFFLTIGVQTPVFAQRPPEMYVVMFRADWCAPCKIVEPNLDQALKNLRNPDIKPIIIDISNPDISLRSAHTAFDHNIVRQYNEWMGVTGFAAIIDADTKNTLGCVNMTYDIGAMTNHIKNLKTYARANQKSFDITCPAPNPPVR